MIEDNAFLRRGKKNNNNKNNNPVLNVLKTRQMLTFEIDLPSPD